MAEYTLKTPISEDEIAKLQLGDTIYISGLVFTARDEAHIELIKHEGIKGFDFNGLALYHAGPVMKEEDGKWKVMAAGPTTSFRMESLESDFLDLFNVKVIIGKGGMGPDTLAALQKHNTVYAAFTGGAGTLAAQGLGEVKDVFYLEELGMPEAVWVFETNNFGPLVVAMDSNGNSLYDAVNKRSKENLESILQRKGL
jgi:tartrate/fumarate subfamily iron-sulfur-dependent hydro-lyase beta chain